MKTQRTLNNNVKPWVRLILMGKYDRVDWDTIHEGRFPELESIMTLWFEPTEVQIIPIPRSMRPDEVIAYLKSKKLRPGTLKDLIVWGAVTPKSKRPAIGVKALGTVTTIDGKRYVAEIDSYYDSWLELKECNNVLYGAGWNFIAVPA